MSDINPNRHESRLFCHGCRNATDTKGNVDIQPTDRNKNMIKIAIVEDEELHSERLKSHLLRFAAEKNTSFEIIVFNNAITFLENYSGNYSVIFMDIRMPYMNGMDAAHKLRELDPDVMLIFITSLTQYAIKGYEVNAQNYIVKPVTYPDFVLKFTKAYLKLQQQSALHIALPTEKGIVKLLPEEIIYCEVTKHQTVFHTIRGDFSQYTTLRAIENKLNGNTFCKCNHCYLVNLSYVKEIEGDEVILGYDGKEVSLIISRNKKKPFADAFKTHLNGGNRGNN